MENINIKGILSNFKLGKFSIAEKETIKLTKKFPNNYFLFNLLGAIFSGQKKLDDAIVNFKKSIKISPNYAEAYNNLAGAFAQKKKYNVAIENFKKAIQINPKFSEAYYNLGNTLAELGQYNESISSYKKAIEFKPDYTKAYNNLGNVFKKINDIDSSIECYEKVIKIDNKIPNAYNKLAVLYCDIGRVKDAQDCYEKLFKIEPDNILYKINNSLLLTPVYESTEQIDFYRKKFEERIEPLKKYKYFTDKPGDEIELNFYYLAYHNKNNLDVLKKISKVFRQVVPNINYTSKNLKNKKNKKKIKIGFISQHFSDHTVGKLFGGLIKNINNKKFETIVFHTLNTKKSSIKSEIDSSVNKVIILEPKIQDQQKQIEDEFLDIIFYPDIGMSPLTYFLAHSRLAPLQIASWGHTETTGIDTIDYFLSAKFFENNSNIKKKYSEKLICLNRIPTYFEYPKNIGKLKTRSELGLPGKANLYGCPQSLFKIHPDFDSVLAKILSKDLNSYLVLIGNQGKDKYWSEILKKRWSKNFPIIEKRTIFTKRLSLLDFYSLSNCVNVLLIPLYFGGGNTSLEAMIFGTPSVTMEGDYLRTNITSAIYKQMQISEPPIAKNKEDYINLAIELAKNNKKNILLREKSKKAAKKYLFENKEALKEFENFLEKIHKNVQ